MDELKECPFCGCAARFYTYDRKVKVGCHAGCIMLPSSNDAYYTSLEAAANAWNTRPTPPPCEYCNPVPGPWEFYKFCPHCGRTLKGEPGTRQGWVDVKNPPEKSGSYWVWSNGHGKDAYFVKENNAWVGVHPRHRPTHWQPLPDAPKEAPPQINPADTLKDFGQGPHFGGFKS